ncbi:MAG: LPS assembly lipoprotein LptE [Planctomycetes bacterium]|nr:LPS assembly lipoprotein LptE [Planctomycetota bacterium]
MKFHAGLIMILAALQAAGCAAYRFGHQTLYRPDIRTVHVPVFASESLRRDLGERLTEAVIKEIEKRTPYKVVASPNADSVLTGRIKRESKRIVANNRYDDARDIETEFLVEVSWVDRQGQLLVQSGGIPVPQLQIGVTADSELLPEAGQPLAVAQQEVIERLAREIVGQMEIWW